MDPLPPTESAHPSGDARQREADRRRPTQIGGYRVLERLGSGGMGIVYLAEQSQPMTRRVAIKVLRPLHDDLVHQARFEREIAALAAMKHANIAQVFDAGTHGESPYYVMEVVDGPPLTTYVDAESLGLRSRLELFLQVCAGVQHAHQRGVIHRDLKPGNVLVSVVEEEPPRPKLIDFGLAKPTGVQSDLSVTGTIVGTPSYMSPEQLQGLDAQVDTRTDVYALGILLYELLTGFNPFRSDERQSLLTLVQRVVEEEPSPPSQCVGQLPEPELIEWARGRGGDPARLARRLKGDLDWITLKALAKEPERRYPSVSDLAADVQRHLDDLPVAAGPPTLRYRSGKFARRHRAAVSVVSGALLLLVLAAVGSTAAWLRAERSERRAVASEQQARQAASETQAINDFLEELLSSPDPARHGRDVRLLALVDERAGHLDRDFHGQPRAEASVRHILGRTYAGLGAYESAAEQLDLAAQLRRRHLGENDPATLETAHESARLVMLQGRLDEADAAARRVAAARAGLLGPEALPTLESRYLSALIAYERGRYEEAFQAFEDLLPSADTAVGATSPLALEIRHRRASVLVRWGRHVEAEAQYREVLARRRASLGPDHPETLHTLNALGNALYRQRRWPEAEAIYREVVERRQAVLGPEHPKTLVAANNLANAVDKQGDYEAAARLYREALAIARQDLGDQHPTTLLLTNNLGNALRHDGRLREAESLYRLARAHQRTVLGPAHPETLRTANNLVKVLLADDRATAADRFTQELVAEAADSVAAWEVRAWLLSELDRAEELVVALTTRRDLAPESLAAWSELGRAQLQAGRTDEAVATYRDALALEGARERAEEVLWQPLLASEPRLPGTDRILDSLRPAPAP